MERNTAKRTLEKLLSVCICLCMLGAMLPAQVFAEEADTAQTEIVQDTAPKDTVYLSSADDLIQLAKNCRLDSWSQNRTVVLEADINLSGVDFNGIPSFGGTWEGQNHAITGLSLSQDGSVQGLFRYVQQGALVRDMTVKGRIKPGGTRASVGGIAGSNAGTIENCAFDGVVSGTSQIGGIAGVNTVKGSINGCTVSGTVYGSHFVGGVVGQNDGVAANCTNAASVNTTVSQNEVKLNDLTLDDVLKTEKANDVTDAGGIAGNNAGVLRACINRGTIGYSHIGYNVGGIAVELYYHAMRTGLLNLILILFGLWLCVKRKKPSMPVLALCELMLSMLLFTRVQNSGSHQMLLYVPAYVILFLCGAAGLAESIEHFKIPKLCFWVFTLLFAVSVRCSPLTVMALPEFVIHAFHPADLAEYQRLDELTYDRKDKPQIQAMAQWLVEHLGEGEGEGAYMIPDDMLYNPGHLRNCDLPNHALDGKLPDSFSVPGTHSFPTGFFDAKYVITADPFPLSLAPDTELGHRFNAVFLQLRETTHQQVATFDMGNGTVFTIWERTTPVTREEVETYLHEFDAENAKYPEMFSSVVENWLAVHGL